MNSFDFPLVPACVSLCGRPLRPGGGAGVVAVLGELLNVLLAHVLVHLLLQTGRVRID